jgi:hypothetical protein
MLAQGFAGCFAALAGVPATMLFDNPKTVTAGFVAGAAVIDPQLVRLATYYRFTPSTAAPHDPEAKGKVETLRVERPLMEGFSNDLLRIHPPRIVAWNLDGHGSNIATLWTTRHPRISPDLRMRSECGRQTFTPCGLPPNPALRHQQPCGSGVFGRSASGWLPRRQPGCGYRAATWRRCGPGGREHQLLGLDASARPLSNDGAACPVVHRTSPAGRRAWAEVVPVRFRPIELRSAEWLACRESGRATWRIKGFWEAPALRGVKP